MRSSCYSSAILRLLFLLVFLVPLNAALAADEPQPYVPAPPSSKDEQVQKQVQRQQTQPGNNAPVWRDVRSEKEHITQVRGVETGVLVQSGGDTWRAFRNGPVTQYGGFVLVVIMAAIGLFHWIHGAIKLHGQPTGMKIQRFNEWERIIHWSTAITFVILGISGLIILFGKHVLLPIIGYTLFSWLAVISKNLHNFVGPLFIFSALVMIVSYLKHNLWKGYDFRWFKNMGGMLGGEHIPSGKFNAGEKTWFWVGLFLLTIVVSVTGLILDFPNFQQGRAVMQQANVIHAIVAIIYIALSLGHIYMGTIGVQGAYDSMSGDGMVDEAWAKEHHEYWYNDVKAGKTGQPPVGATGAGQTQQT